MPRRCPDCHNKLSQSNMSADIVYCSNCMEQFDKEYIDESLDKKNNNN